MKKNNNRNLSQADYIASLLSPTGTQKLSKSAKDKIEKLAVLINKGEQGAAAELYSTAAFAVWVLSWLCKRKPEPFKDIAREKFSWPVLYGLHPQTIRETAAFLRDLELGRNTQINLSSGKTFSWEVPANVVALNLHKLAQSLRRAPISNWGPLQLRPIATCGIGRRPSGVHVQDAKYWRQMKALDAWGQSGAGRHLPPLSKQTAGQWATATKELFKIAYPGKFEEHPNLQDLRASVWGRAKNAYGKTGRGEIRKAMLQAVKQAWRSIAALD